MNKIDIVYSYFR